MGLFKHAFGWFRWTKFVGLFKHYLGRHNLWDFSSMIWGDKICGTFQASFGGTKFVGLFKHDLGGQNLWDFSSIIWGDIICGTFQACFWMIWMDKICGTFQAWFGGCHLCMNKGMQFLGDFKHDLGVYNLWDFSSIIWGKQILELFKHYFRACNFTF